MSTEHSENSEYNQWTVAKLQAMFKVRSIVPSSGKKAVLVDRLCVADRYPYLDSYIEEHVEQEFVRPQASNYKELSSSCISPDFTESNIEVFLDRYQKSDDGGRALYKDGFLMFVRVAYEDDSVFFLAQCHAEMKGTYYYVDLKIHMDGHIAESHCECAVGEGLIAHCKHVIALLWGVEEMRRTDCIVLHKSCTEKLQTFHKPKTTFKGSPLKASGFRSSEPLAYSAVNQRFKMDSLEVRKQKYADRVRNIFFSKPDISSSVTMLFEPANPRGITNDHNYSKTSAEDVLLRRLGLLDVSEDYTKEVEVLTQNQAKSNRWKEERRIRVTSSDCKRVCSSKPESRKKLSQDLLYPKPFSTAATEYGKENESKALKQYAEDFGLSLEKCGLCICLSHPFFAASPDALLEDETVIEVKCPYRLRGADFKSVELQFLTQNAFGQTVLNPNHKYFYQIQGQLFATSRKYANMIVYSSKQYKVFYVSRDENVIDEITTKCQDFFFKLS